MENIEIVELIGSKKEVKIAKEIRKNIVERVLKSDLEFKEEIINHLTNKVDNASYFIYQEEEFAKEDLNEIFARAIKFYARRKNK